MIRIKKGLELPITGKPSDVIDDGKPVSTVALIGADYVGMKPTFAVTVGDAVKQGQLLFTDKKNPRVCFTSPGCGRVAAINRGKKRVFQSIVIALDGSEEEQFPSFENADLTALSRDQVRDSLLKSGLWPSFRTRPYSKIAAADAQPHSIFVTAMETNPLAAPLEPILREGGPEFVYGLQALRHLTDGKLFLCKRPGETIPGDDLDFVTAEEFEGPHPAGLPGTHIHFLDPVSESKSVWWINGQDVTAIGRFLVSGRLPVERVVSVAGPAVRNPRLFRTRMGANLSDLTRDELDGDGVRVISGSVLSGRTSIPPFDFLGRYHFQISALREGRERVFLGWQRPGMDKFSVKRVFASAVFGRNREFPLTSSLEGSARAMVPVGSFESVMPLDILPTFLLRALLVGDTEQAQNLGCLELDEEDLALCTFVCPGKHEYGPVLRENLTRIEKDG